MQWEFTGQAGGSGSGSNKNAFPTEPPESNAASTTGAPTDDSIRDVSMAVVDHDEDDAGENDATDGEIASTQVITRRRNRSLASSRADADDDDRNGDDDARVVSQWPATLPPMVGTVINYLVPPVRDQQDAATSGKAATPASVAAHTTLHPRERPLLFLSYAQALFNLSMLFLVTLIVTVIAWSIFRDIRERLAQIEYVYHHAIHACKRSYELNCLTVPIPPALHQACENWSACSQKRLEDALGGSRLRVGIEVLAEAWEAGVAGLGWRTLVFSLLVLSLFVGGANSTLNGWRLGAFKQRRRNQEHVEQQRRSPSQPAAPLPPPTPQQQQPQQLYYPSPLPQLQYPHHHQQHFQHYATPTTPRRSARKTAAARTKKLHTAASLRPDGEWEELSD